jgi:hypothetical protein
MLDLGLRGFVRNHMSHSSDWRAKRKTMAFNCFRRLTGKRGGKEKRGSRGEDGSRECSGRRGDRPGSDTPNL